jgi:hypothetical protein
MAACHRAREVAGRDAAIRHEERQHVRDRLLRIRDARREQHEHRDRHRTGDVPPACRHVYSLLSSFWSTVNVLPATVIVPLRSLPVFAV